MKSYFKLITFLIFNIILGRANAQTYPFDVPYSSSLYNIASFSRAINLAKPIGVVKGMAGTSPNGSSSYTIPIECPPGTNGMVPSVSLVYNSQAGNGIAGQGWSIAGLSVISRGGKDTYHDGKVAPVTYTNNDVFLLDGTRLFPFSGSNGSNGTSYRTEMESYSTINSYDYSGGDATSPKQFKVVSKDGTKMEYGYTSDSRIMSNDNSKVMMWRLNRIEDINGNYIDFVYDNTDRDSRIAEIRYTGNTNTGLSPYNSIAFSYASRFDKNIIYDGGYSLESKYLLLEIQVKSEGEVFKKYQPHYGKDATSTFLQDFIEFIPDETVLNETRFKYGEISSSNVTEVSNSDADISSTPNDLYSADFNGDGHSDLLVATKAVDAALNLPYSTGFKIKIYNPISGTYSTTETVTLSGGFATVNKVPFVKNVYSLAPSDFNGDGIEDVVITNTHNAIIGTDTRRILDNIKISYLNTSGTFSSTETIATPSGYSIINPRYNYFYTGDFNGDGRTDIITILSNYTGFNVFFSSPSIGIYNQMVDIPSSSHPYYKENNIFFNADRVSVINMDGDAKSDLMIVRDGVVSDGKTDLYTFNFSGGSITMDVTAGALGYPTTWHDIYYGDFNGDGKTDILTCSNPPSFPSIYWEVAYSDGKSFQSGPLIISDHLIKQNTPTYYSTSSTDAIAVGDFNGDGKSDVYNYYINGSTRQHRIYYSSGKNFELNSQSTTRYWGKLALGDYNGDGKTDILNYHGATDAQFQYFKPYDKSLLLEKVNDGFNRTTEFTYESLTKGTGSGSGDFYTRGSGETYPVNNGQYPMYVTTAIKNPNGIGGTSTTNFKYENLRIHRSGRGMLGFEKVKSYNLSADIRSESISDLNRDFFVPYLKTTKTFLNSTGAQLTQSDETVSFEAIPSSYCFKQQNTSSVAQDMLKGVTTTSSNTYDSYGNVIVSTTEITGGSLTHTTTTNATFVSTGGSYIPNRPSEIISTNKRGSMPSVATIATMTYDAKGRNLTTTSKPYPITGSTTLHYVLQTNTFDDYGNTLTTKKSTFSSFSPHTPTTKFEFDSKGRFAISEENALTHKKYITTHKFWGKPLSVTDFNGLTNTYTYDNWGKLTSTTIPTSTSTSYTINYSEGWDISGNQLYYKLTQDPTAPDVKIWYDYLDRPIKTKQETFAGAWTEALNTYDTKGNVATSTNSYLPTETPITTTNSYDALNRLASSTNVFGTTSYNYLLGSGEATTTVTLPDAKVKKTTEDASGKVIKSTNGIAGTVHYTYDSWGNEVNSGLGTPSMAYHNLIQKEYDANGRLKKMIDPDAGTTTYFYNPFGQLLTQVDPKGKATTYQYDIVGRVTQKNLDAYAYYYGYWGQTKDYRLQALTITGPDGSIEDFYDYKIGGELTVHIKTDPASGVVMHKKYTYDDFNNPISTEYVNSGFKTKNYYDANGFLQKITTNLTGTLATEKLLYEASAMNGNGQITHYKRVDGLNATTSYNNGFATNYNTPGIQDLSMSYDYSNGNIMYRLDDITQTKEDFEYDAIDRLTKASAQKLGGGTGMMHIPLETNYKNGFWGSFGQIDSKSDVGNYGYSGFPRNAVKSLTDPATIISHGLQKIDYNTFHKTQKITEDISGVEYEEKFVYDGNDDRAYSQQKQGGTTGSIVRKRWYDSDFEIDQKISGTGTNTRQLHYLSTDVGLVGIVVEEGGLYHYYAAYTDHLGSIVTLTDDAGTVVAKQSYDPWGRERNPDTWGYGITFTSGGTTPVPPDWLYRGYTGHEMLPEYGLINMNGRMYDPINGRMLRPDNFVSDPTNSQAYNRFSYAMNNPVMFTDPDGNFPLAAVLIGVAFGMYTGGSMANGGQLNPAKWDYNSGRTWTYMAAGGIVGGFSGGLGAQIAQGGGFFANTLGIMASSFTNSLGTALYTGGRSGMSLNFGIASYNFINGDVGYLGEKGNKWYQNLGYAMGALANVQDAVAWNVGGDVNYRSEYGDVPHARLEGATNNKIDVSVAHVDPTGVGLGGYYKTSPEGVGFAHNLEYAKYWSTHIKRGEYFPVRSSSALEIKFNNVNQRFLEKMTSNIKTVTSSGAGKGLFGLGNLKYGTTLFGCQSHVGQALWGVGIPTLPINFHPMVLYSQLLLRQGGIIASPFLTR
jgi:RHS repeat-associated protein